LSRNNRLIMRKNS